MLKMATSNVKISKLIIFSRVIFQQLGDKNTKLRPMQIKIRIFDKIVGLLLSTPPLPVTLQCIENTRKC